MADTSHRSAVDAWMRDYIDANPRLEIPGLAEEALRHFRRDEQFMRSIAEDAIYLWFYDAARSGIHSTRKTTPVAGTEDPTPAPIPPAGETTVWNKTIDLPEILRRTRRAAPHFARFMENLGKKQIRLLDMTREEVVAAAEIHDDRSAYEGRRRDFLLYLADQMGDDDKVCDRFNADDLRSIYDELGGF